MGEFSTSFIITNRPPLCHAVTHRSLSPRNEIQLSSDENGRFLLVRHRTAVLRMVRKMQGFPHKERRWLQRSKLIERWFLRIVNIEKNVIANHHHRGSQEPHEVF